MGWRKKALIQERIQLDGLGRQRVSVKVSPKGATRIDFSFRPAVAVTACLSAGEIGQGGQSTANQTGSPCSVTTHQSVVGSPHRRRRYRGRACIRSSQAGRHLRRAVRARRDRSRPVSRGLQDGLRGHGVEAEGSTPPPRWPLQPLAGTPKLKTIFGREDGTHSAHAFARTQWKGARLARSQFTKAGIDSPGRQTSRSVRYWP